MEKFITTVLMSGMLMVPAAAQQAQAPTQPVTISPQLYVNIVNYLASRPWMEVNGMIGELVKAQPPAKEPTNGK